MQASSESGTILSPRAHARPFLLCRGVAASDCFQRHPPVPVLPATRLQLDLLLKQSALNLQAILGVILNDVGASLQVLRATSRGAGNFDRHSGRIKDCVLDLGRKRLRDATAATFSMAAGRRNEAAQQLWTRARLTAELSQIIAGRLPGINPPDAYLAGLLHEAGRIPALLGWSSNEIDINDAAAVGRAIAKEWMLPLFVGPTLLLSSASLQPLSRLQQVVAVAWEMSNAICCGRPLTRKPLLPTAEPGRASLVGTLQTQCPPPLRPFLLR